MSDAKLMWEKGEKIGTRDAYGQKLAALAPLHKNIVVLDADLSGSTKTKSFQKIAPERFFNCGVAEQDLVGTAAGLAHDGFTVFASTFAMFAAGRAWEVIRQSVAYPKLNVKICPTHAGITVGEDGASHQMIEDIALMRVIPQMHVYVPADAYQVSSMMDHMIQDKSPTYLRMGRAKVPVIFDENYKFVPGKGTVLRKGEKVCLFVTGYPTADTLAAAEKLSQDGINPTVVNLASVKPIDADLIVEMAKSHDVLFSIEEHSVIGGLGSAISEVLCSRHPATLHRLGMQDEFGQTGPANELLAHYKLDAAGLVGSIKAKL